MTQLLTYAKQQEIKPVIIDDINIYNQIAIETQGYHLRRLLGDPLYNALIANPTETRMVLLLEGDNWTINGFNYSHNGLLYVLAYITYAAWIKRSKLIETYSGVVIQKSDYSEPASDGYVKNIADEAEKIAMDEFERVKNYIFYSNNYPEIKQDKPNRIFETLRRY